MKSFWFKVTDHLKVEDIELAVGALVEGTREPLASDAPGSAACVSVLTEADVADAIARSLQRDHQVTDLRRQIGQLMAMLTTIVKESGWKIQLLQSQMDEAVGWEFSAGAGENRLVLTVKPPRGSRLVT